MLSPTDSVALIHSTYIGYFNSATAFRILFVNTEPKQFIFPNGPIFKIFFVKCSGIIYLCENISNKKLDLSFFLYCVNILITASIMFPWYTRRYIEVRENLTLHLPEELNTMRASWEIIKLQNVGMWVHKHHQRTSLVDSGMWRHAHARG